MTGIPVIKEEQALHCAQVIFPMFVWLRNAMETGFCMLFHGIWGSKQVKYLSGDPPVPAYICLYTWIRVKKDCKQGVNHPPDRKNRPLF